MKTYISIATYNEKENIQRLIQDIFNLGIEDLHVVVVDDNSPDGTSQVVETLKEQYSNLDLIKRTGKLGYGSAHVTAFKKALENQAGIIISMDADFSHDPIILPQLIETVAQGNDVAVGSRRVKGGQIIGWGLWRKFCSAGAMLASKLILGIKTNDLTSGYRAYRSQIFKDIDLDRIKSNGYSFLEELIYLIEKKNYLVKEVPIIFVDRQLGKSKLSKKEIAKFFITIFKIKFKK